MLASMRPLVLLDVDGPLNPFAAKADALPEGYREHRLRLSRWRREPQLRLWLNPDHGPRLIELAGHAGADLVWATTWEHRANSQLAPLLGLPELPVIYFGEPVLDSVWKYPAVARYAHGRTLLWFDDDFDLYPRARDEFLAGRGDTPTELVRVNPRTGLGEPDFDHAREWLAGVRRPG
ncbi:hypothetical protein GCM10010452_27460 [Crossiella cryophila]